MITLGLVAAIDDDGVYVEMPGSRGVLRGPYETLQNLSVGDKVLVVSTDDGENVIVGLVGASVPGVSIPDGSITSAKIANGTIVNEDVSASAAIDKTKISGTAVTAADTGTVTNAMLAGSIAASKITGTAVTQSDSGTVTSAMIANSTIVNADISGSAAIDRSKISGLPTSSTDNTLPKFDSTGGALQTSGIVVDDNNRLRVASGSSGGLEIGSSGVLHMSGTGGPSGISAPVGSTWRDTNATTGAIKWLKASGSGSSGWVVEYGDTGWRNLAAESLLNSWAVGSSVFAVRRVGSNVTVRFVLNGTSATGSDVYVLPTGFRPDADAQWYVPNTGNSAGRRGYIQSNGTLTISLVAATYCSTYTFSTVQAWPSSLPGTAL